MREAVLLRRTRGGRPKAPRLVLILAGKLVWPLRQGLVGLASSRPQRAGLPREAAAVAGKARQAAASAAACAVQILDCADLGGLRAFAALSDHELYALALLQGLEARSLDLREVSE